MIRAVALDLMDTVVRDPYREALAAAVDVDLGELFARRDPDLYPSLERGEIEESVYWEHQRRAGITVDPERFHEVRLAETTWLPGMRELLDDLDGVVERVTASNYPAWIDVLADEILGGRFDRVVASCHLGARKPDAAFYERLLQRIGLEAHEVAFVDDRESNVAAAHAVGIPSHRFEHADGVRRWLRQLGLGVTPRGDVGDHT
jgi:HAD superfamily hydrolase (TIGR01509 family)